ncbi:hypothetical protein Plhal703r1_c48g0151031 [Plasmopara halstedii]
MTSARGTQQRIHSGNCDDSNNSQLCSQLASTWGPEHRCLAVAAVDEGAERADCVEGVARYLVGIVQMIDQLPPLGRRTERVSRRRRRTVIWRPLKQLSRPRGRRRHWGCSCVLVGHCGCGCVLVGRSSRSRQEKARKPAVCSI